MRGSSRKATRGTRPGCVFYNWPRPSQNGEAVLYSDVPCPCCSKAVLLRSQKRLFAAVVVADRLPIAAQENAPAYRRTRHQASAGARHMHTRPKERPWVTTEQAAPAETGAICFECILRNVHTATTTNRAARRPRTLNTEA